MKTHSVVKCAVLGLFVGMWGFLTHADQLGIYTFTGAAGNEATFPVDAQPADATFSDMSRGAGVTPGTAANAFSASGWSTATLDTSDYYNFDITANGPDLLTLTNLNFSERRSSTGIRDISIRTSLDSFTSDIFTTNVPDNDQFRAHSVALDGSFASISSVTFRIYGYTAESSSGTWRIDDVALFGYTGELGAPQTNVFFDGIDEAVSEAGGSYTVVVFKSLSLGDVSGEIAISGSATEGVLDDFTISGTNFTMNGAVTSASFIVSFNDDSDIESLETVVLSIVNVTGGTIVSPSVRTISIADNDSPPSTLIISEVADPSDAFNARFVEIYNAGTTTVDLAAGSWFLSRQSNGGSTWGDIALGGVIAAGAAYVVAANETTYLSSYPAAPAADIYSSEINSNGDDGYFLYRAGDHENGTLADAYGVIDLDGTGQPWEFEDTRAVRTSTVVQGSTTWLASEWFIPASASTADMTPGVHPEGVAVTVTNVRFNIASDTVLESAGAYIVTVTKTLPEGDVSGEITLAGTATEGSLNDYTISITNFTLNGAETSTNIVITINDDAEQELAETIILGFANIVGAGISAPSSFTLNIQANDAPPPPGGVIWINEINYNPAGTDSNEFIEIAGPSGIDLSPYQIVWYNGSGGVVYGSNVLSGVIGDEGCGFGAVSFSTSLQNGPDGLALVSNNTTVIEFISYGGTFLATEGPANGLNAVDIGVVQNNTNDTVQLGGSGDTASEFTWEVAAASSSNLNVNQTITPCGDEEFPPVLAAIGNQIVNESNLLVFAVTATPTDADPVILTVSNAPAGSSFSSTNENGTFTWVTPTPTGVYTVSFYASDNDGTDSETITITVTAAPPVIVPGGMNLGLWINELHYDNTGIAGDTNEGFEVAGAAGVDLGDYSMYLYDSVTGGAYSNIPLSGIIPNLSNGYGVIWFGLPYTLQGEIQNGSADGMALVYQSTGVIQFISYEGVVNAISGPASGMSSVDIGAFEPGSTPEGFSLQLCGTGTNFAQMVATGGWITNAHSYGEFTSCQVIPETIDAGTTLDQYEVDVMALSGGTFSITINVSSNGVPYTLIYTTNILTDPQGSGTADVENGNGSTITLQDVGPTDPSRLYWLRSND